VRLTETGFREPSWDARLQRIKRNAEAIQRDRDA
jgi:hypothetical protein